MSVNAAKIQKKKLDRNFFTSYFYAVSQFTTDFLSKRFTVPCCLANAGEKSDKTDGRKKARRAHIHPLAVPLDDFKAGNAFFVESVKNSKRLEHKFALPKIVQLPQDRYLAEAQPSSLGLMQIEKIRSYVDDRGNKGNDWAAFRINTMKLSKEG